MGILMEKAWRPLTAEETSSLGGHLGVYELANAAGEVVFVGYAGGKSLHGLRGELSALAASNPHGATHFRAEVNMQYLSRWKELLMAHQAKDGAMPPGNRANAPRRIGRVHLG